MKEKWNRKYLTMQEPNINENVKQFYSLAKKGKALDIACGLGQNAKFLAQNGFEVDAVDISEVAIEKLQNFSNIHTFCQDIDAFEFKKEYYNLIVCTNFFDRSIAHKIIESLKKDGIFICEVFTYKSSVNPEFVAHKNELCQLFCELEIIHYNLIEDETKAILVGKK
ncbi:class I SAM-dependent methyltransferase [Nitratiruptor sp. SB155-2]|uniref:class I SAM-dependent methyltransferase n=1 Tax=Nitratiruptor sp. (strain SB155-2) TaxID=387092 RepID=UPI000158720B|nr:methyltransferase domain-containing protein [Nitratiruptor sp. SB155-2]BAF70069.1 tellurite resistance protein TehB [Nitratiruptor sp. SB155-2]